MVVGVYRDKSVGENSQRCLVGPHEGVGVHRDDNHVHSRAATKHLVAQIVSACRQHMLDFGLAVRTTELRRPSTSTEWRAMRTNAAASCRAPRSVAPNVDGA